MMVSQNQNNVILILFFAPKQAQDPTLATLKLKTEVYTFGKIQTT